MKRQESNVPEGFAVSLALAIVVFFFSPHGVLQDLYRWTGWPIAVIFCFIMPDAFEKSLNCWAGVPVSLSLGALLIWGLFFSIFADWYRSLNNPVASDINGMPEAVRYPFIGLGIALIFLLLISAIIPWACSDLSFYGRDFDRSVWDQAMCDSSGSPRCGMAKGLQRRFMQEKSTRKDVIRLLGEPDDMSEADKMRKGFMSYSLGMCSWIDYDSLDIYLDKDDRVKCVYIVQH